MATFKEIQASNNRLNDATAPSVALFVGGTSGIGKETIRALVSTGLSIRIYVVGRKSSEDRTRDFFREMKNTNASAELVWVEGEISLLAETRRICEILKARESHLDLLFLSTGYAPFGQRQETIEGVEVSLSLEYYTRIMFVQCLIPLLEKGERPRVVSVLGGGLEQSSIDLQDLDLKQPGKFGPVKVQTHCIMLNTMMLEKLSDQHPDITFIHSWPGWVSTGNAMRGVDPGSILVWVIRFVLEPIIYMFGYSHEVSAQMHLFQCTSAVFGGHGSPWWGIPGTNSHGKQENGLFLVNYKCHCTPNAKVVPALRAIAREQIWAHTQAVMQPYL